MMLSSANRTPTGAPRAGFQADHAQRNPGKDLFIFAGTRVVPRGARWVRSLTGKINRRINTNCLICPPNRDRNIALRGQHEKIRP
jgi:hypothetical protein